MIDENKEALKFLNMFYTAWIEWAESDRPNNTFCKASGLCYNFEIFAVDIAIRHHDFANIKYTTNLARDILKNDLFKYVNNKSTTKFSPFMSKANYEFRSEMESHHLYAPRRKWVHQQLEMKYD